MKKTLDTKKIYFRAASKEHEEIIFQWLEEPHMKEFWDNTQEHKDDILNFIHGRKQTYFCGTTKYWIGYYGQQAFSFILSDEILPTEDLNELYRQFLSKSGHTISLDFGIGNIVFLGKSLAAPTLQAFTKFYKHEIDPKADTFFIDPDEHNPRAFRVYEKAGFEMVGSFIMKGGAFDGQRTYLMVKNLN